MDADTWRRVKEIYGRAIELPPAGRVPGIVANVNDARVAGKEEDTRESCILQRLTRLHNGYL